MISTKTFRSKGKLLITGEYAVLDGAQALAIPTRAGQSLHIHDSGNKNDTITWLAYKHNGELWFDCILDIKNKKIVKTNNPDFAQTLLTIFLKTEELGTNLFKENFGYECETQLEFPEVWGLGSSSTLINNIAKWANVNPYQLLAVTFGGSGYDIACAGAANPVTYQLVNGQPVVKDVFIPSEISDNLLFIYLNQKQNSREGIKHYKQKPTSTELVQTISDITRKISNPKCSLSEFSDLIYQHESCISDFIEIKTVKEKLFPDYPGFIKSLGAWGGDFIMAEKKEDGEEYFKSKGYKTIKKYDGFLL